MTKNQCLHSFPDESQPCKSNNFFLKISTSSYYNFIPLFSNIYSSPLKNTFNLAYFLLHSLT